jgi:hypothetical protein
MDKYNKKAVAEYEKKRDAHKRNNPLWYFYGTPLTYSDTMMHNLVSIINKFNNRWN